MVDLTLRNASTYVGLWVLNALVGCLALGVATGKLYGFGAGGFFEPIAQETATGLTLLGSGLTIWLAANRPKLGREDISALVSEIGALDAKAVLRGWRDRRDESVAPLADDEIDRMADRMFERIEARMQQDREAPHA